MDAGGGRVDGLEGSGGRTDECGAGVGGARGDAIRSVVLHKFPYT